MPSDSAASVVLSRETESSRWRRSGPTARFDDFVIFPVGNVQGVGGVFNPGRGVLLQVINLQLGDGGIARVHVFALLDQRLCEFLAPRLLQLLDLPQRDLHLIGSWPERLDLLKTFH